ncbi:MAG TPA: sialidase family protein [Gemmatimonadaceae bacterium]|nr:sialidase family protein [Gemmatimonadaceae bacterium]
MTVRNFAAQLVLAVATARSAVAQRQVDSATCVGEHWLPPRALQTVEGYTVYMTLPAMVPLRGEMFFSGSLAPAFDSLGHVAWPLSPNGASPTETQYIPVGATVGVHGAARLVPLMKNAPALMAMPTIAATDDRGVVHVLFGSNDSTALARIDAKRSVWYTSFDGDQWTTPTRILTTPPGTMIWIPSSLSQLVARGRTLHAIVTFQSEGLRYLRSDRGRWSDRRVNLASGPFFGYPQLAVLSDGRIVLMVQGPGERIPSTSFASGAYVAFSDDQGATWSTPLKISARTGEPSHDFRLVVDEQDVLYALWYQQTDVLGNQAPRFTLGGTPGRIHVAQSFDRGVSWHQYAPSPLLDNAGELQVLLRRDHSLLAAVVDRAGERMLVASWHKEWSPFLSIDAKPHPANPSLGADDAQRPFLTWGTSHTHDWTVTMLTALVPCSR